MAYNWCIKEPVMPRKSPFEITFGSAIKLAVAALRPGCPHDTVVVLDAARRGFDRAPGLASNDEDRERAERFRDAFFTHHGSKALDDAKIATHGRPA